MYIFISLNHSFSQQHLKLWFYVSGWLFVTENTNSYRRECCQNITMILCWSKALNVIKYMYIDPLTVLIQNYTSYQIKVISIHHSDWVANERSLGGACFVCKSVKWQLWCRWCRWNNIYMWKSESAVYCITCSCDQLSIICSWINMFPPCAVRHSHSPGRPFLVSSRSSLPISAVIFTITTTCFLFQKRIRFSPSIKQEVNLHFIKA